MEHWSETPIRNLMHRPLVVDEKTSLESAVNRLQDPDAHCLIVVDLKGRLKGLFTEQDMLDSVLGRVCDGTRPVGEFVRTEVFSLGETATVGQVIDIMGRNFLRYLPLCDQQGVPKGVFSIHGLINYISGQTAAEASGRHNTKPGRKGKVFGGAEEAIIEVLNLPVSFAFGKYGFKDCLRVAVGESIATAATHFRGKDQQAALVYDEGRPIGLLRLLDIPFKALHREGNFGHVPVRDFMIDLPVVVGEKETIGIAVKRMAESGILFLRYGHERGNPGLISGSGLVSYIYDHIYEDA